MNTLRYVFVLLLSTALSLPMTGCQKEYSDLPGPDTMAVAFFSLAAHDNAAPMLAALGPEVSEDGVRAAFLLPNGDSSMSDELTAQFAEMGITVSAEDVKLLSDANLSLMKKVTCTAQVKTQDDNAGTATVTVSVSTFPTGTFASAATAAVNEMDLSEFLSDDLSPVYSKIVRTVADTLSNLQPSGEPQSIDIPFSLQELSVNGRPIKLWAPDHADEFLSQVTALITGDLT